MPCFSLWVFNLSVFFLFFCIWCRYLLLLPLLSFCGDMTIRQSASRRICMGPKAAAALYEHEALRPRVSDHAGAVCAHHICLALLGFLLFANLKN
jgi:hypothetical protein